MLVLKSVNGDCAERRSWSASDGHVRNADDPRRRKLDVRRGTSLPAVLCARGRRTLLRIGSSYTIVNGLGLEATAQLRITVGRSTVTATGTPTRTHVAPIARDNEADANAIRCRRLSGT